MYASIESTLPRHGFGSESWFNKTFNFEIERQKVSAVIESEANPLSIITWLHHEVTTFLTEWGVGREALTVQPATSYDITISDGKPNIFAHSLNEFGEQLESYLHFEDMPESIGKGLQQAFETLTHLQPGEGAVILSPTELYQNYNSPGDVINPLLVNHVEYDQEGKVTEINATGWFLFVNRKLTPKERQYWFAVHSNSSHPESLNYPENIVSSPQYWRTTNDETSEEDDPVKDYMSNLNVLFVNKFGQPLFPTKKEAGLKSVIRQNVDREIHILKEFLVQQQKTGFLKKLWSLMQDGQKTWAELMNIDFDWYWSQVMQGQIQIMGFHPAGNSDDFSDTNSLLSNDLEPSNRCKIHGRFRGHRCPKCNK